MPGDKVLEEITFHSNGILTLGVEVELQLLDAGNGHLVPRAAEVLQAGQAIKGLKPEFFLSTIEINTRICGSVAEVERDLKESFAALLTVGEELNITFSTTGTHPFASYHDAVISPDSRYKELIQRYQWIVRRMSVYGLHVHIGMATPDDCIRFGNFFTAVLPHLLALSSSSPFWHGVDTGLAACRPTIYESLPVAGQPYPMQDWADFERIYGILRRCGSIRSLKDIGWDWRPSPGYGTLEIRLCDGVATLFETMGIVAFIHTLAHWYSEHRDGFIPPAGWLARENKWRAIRCGTDAELITGDDGKIIPLKEDLEQWLDRLMPYAEKLGCREQLMRVPQIAALGSSSHRQRSIFQETASLEEAVKYNAAEFARQEPGW